MPIKQIDPSILKKLKAVEQARLDNQFKNSMKQYTPQPVIWTHVKSYASVSPTDVGARGIFEYQEPEVDEQGTYYGYKVLHRNVQGIERCGCDECCSLISPRYTAKWLNGELQANQEPSEGSMFGIHCTKRPNHPELRNYFGRFHGAAYSSSWYENSQADSVLVKCALSGTIVETEQGFRAQHAQIIGVFFDGNWQSYQDYQRCSQAHSRRIAEEREVWKDWGSYSHPIADPFTDADI